MVRSSSLPPSGRSSVSSFVHFGNPTGFPPSQPSSVGSPAAGNAAGGGGFSPASSTNNPPSAPTAGFSGMTGGVSFAPQPFRQPTARPAAVKKVQSPFMYSGFGTSTSGMKPAYMGFGAQAPQTQQATGVRPSVVNVSGGSIPRAASKPLLTRIRKVIKNRRILTPNAGIARFSEKLEMINF